MDYKDLLFVVFLFFFYSFALLTYVAVGNTILGEKVIQVAQIYNSRSKGFHEYYTTGKKSSKLIFPIYYVVFFIFVVASFFLMMSLRSTFRSWIDRMLGTVPAEEEQHHQRPVTPIFSDSSLTTQASDTPASPSTSKTAVEKKSSKSKMKVSPSRSVTKTMSVKKKNKEKVPSVMRASIVDPENQIIPPLPRLSIREDTAEKLSRVLTKFDSISVPQEEWTPPSRRKND